MNQRIERILRWTKGQSLLDVGCSGGILNVDSPYWLHKHLRDRFPIVVGIDINQQAVDDLTRMGFECYVANAESFELGRTFDTIVAAELIEHLSSPGLFFERALHHLNQGGLLIVTTPYPFGVINVAYAFMKFPRTCSNPQHTMWFCPSTLAELGRRYGYRVAHWELVEDYYDDVPRPLYRLFVRVRKGVPAQRLRKNCILFVFERQ